MPRGPLVSAVELARILAEPNVRVVDVRWYLGKPGVGRAAYEAGHIPGAIFLDLDTDLSDHDGFGAPGRHPLPSPASFAARLGAAGIGTDDFVVAYDDMGGTIAARLWWMLDDLGHRGVVAVLNGGIQAWRAAGLPVATDSVRLPAATLDLASEWTRVIEREELAGRLGTVSLLDGRAPERYRGEVEPVDPAAGHIPTAVNAPVMANVTEVGAMRAAPELREMYSALTVAGQPAIVSCGSGTTACHNALAMRVAGMPDPILYVGSFSDWSRSGMPVATGPDAGDAPRDV